jgi:hypothetical protein
MTLIIIGILLCAATSFGGNKIEPLYNIDESRALNPQMYKTKSSSSFSLFPVPWDNAIGTNDLNNAITILSFHKGKVKYDQYFKNAFSQVGGGGIFLPVFSPDTIGFGQVRRFVFYNFRTKKHERYRVAVSLEEYIKKIAIADAGKRHFIFEVKEFNRHSEDHRDFTNYLRLMDLSGEEPKLIKEMNIGKATGWTTAVGKTFLYDLKAKKMQVLDMNLEESHHPLAEIVKKHGDKISFTRVQPHPYLPFAIIYAGEYGSSYITWDSDRSSCPLQLFSGAYDFSFAPDGKWLVFKKENFSADTIKTYIMPVSEKCPNYLGAPILLMDFSFSPDSCGWTTNPISFVGSSGHELYRWELTNEAHPESDKPTFHDYIVEKDLEKLTRRPKKRPKKGQVFA